MTKNNILFVGSGNISPEPFVYAECEKSLGKNFKQHCDYHELVSDKGMIGIGAVRELLSSIKRYPSFSDEHITAIPEIDLLTVEAQNALLKVVEEGQDNVIFFCGCRNPEAVLETIRSRMQMVACTKMSLDDFCKETDTEGEVGRMLYDITGGDLSRVDDEAKDVLAILLDVKGCIASHDKRGVLASLNCIRERDRNCFYDVHRNYVPALFRMFMDEAVEVLNKCPRTYEVVSDFSKAIRESRGNGFSRSDFYDVVAEMVQKL